MAIAPHPGTRNHALILQSLQLLLEETLLEKVRHLYEIAPSENLCLAGGVALNCVANGRIHVEGPFQNVFVQPAAGDSGTALGAAALAHIDRCGERHSYAPLSHVYLGPAYDTDGIARLLAETGIEALDFRGNEPALLDAVVDRLADVAIVLKVEVLGGSGGGFPTFLTRNSTKNRKTYQKTQKNQKSYFFRFLKFLKFF